MPSTGFLTLTPDSDSLATPGTKVILSEDLSSLTDYDSFLDAYLQHARDPVPVWVLPVESSRELKELGGESFTFKSTLDRTKMGALGETLTEDPPFSWYSTIVDRTAGKLETKMFVRPNQPPAVSEDDPLFVFHTQVNKSPLQMEIYVEVKDENGDLKRECHEYWANMILPTMSGIVQQMKEEKIVKVRRGESRKDPSKTCALSEPLDAHTSLAAILDSSFLSTVGAMKMAGVTDITEAPGEFKCTLPQSPMFPAVVQGAFSLDKAAKEIQAVYTADGETFWKVMMVFHEDPLQLEAWAEVKGERCVPVPFIRDQSIGLNAALATES